MKGERLVNLSERWFRLLERLYPPDFRDEMGQSVVEAYRDRAREALDRGGPMRLAGLWVRALVDSRRNGPGERLRPAVAWRRSGNWGRDAELALRRLLRAPALVFGVVATLSVGLGLFAVVYTVVQKILIERMPYKDPDDLYFVWRDYGPIFELKRGWLGGPDIAELQKAGGAIESVSGVRRQLATFAPRENGDPTEIALLMASPNLFELLGVEPMLGRGFAQTEVGPGRPDVIVLTHDLWTRLGADRAILGTDVRVNGQPFTVIGVMPPAFRFAQHSSLGQPLPVEAVATFNFHLAEVNPNAGSYAGVLRARRGTAPEAVSAAVDAVGRTIDARSFRSRGLRLYPVGLKADLVSAVRPALVAVGVAGVLLVLVLMVNLASVLLARAAQREHEFAVSRALGANGAAIARATLFEGGLLGFAGGAVATLFAIWGTRTLVALAPLDLPRRDTIAVDGTVAAVVTGIGGMLGLFAAVTPAVWAARATLSSLLASSAVRGGGGHGRLRRAMVVGQVTLSLVLLGAGGLVVRSFERLLDADPGFRSEGVLTVRVPIPNQFVSETRDVIVLQDRIEQALGTIPGVTGVSATTALPLTAAASQNTVAIAGAPGNTGDAERDRPLVDFMGVRARYVEVMGMRLVEGRSFDPTRHDGAREAIVDVTLAKRFFPTGTALGAKIPFGGEKDPPLTVVGVVQQARLYDVHQDGRPQILLRAEDFGYRNLIFVLRTGRDPRSLVPDLRRVVRVIDARLALSDPRPMDDVVGNAVRRQRVGAVLIAGFALGALLLAAMGLFGVIATSVTRRRHELAVRLAVGANHGRLLRLVLGEGAVLVGLGVLIGVPGIYIVGPLMGGLLVGVSLFDPITLGAAGLGLGVVSMIACYLPARRVLGIDPALSLRQ
jgi:putative ABC transport system permease protein